MTFILALLSLGHFYLAELSFSHLDFIKTMKDSRIKATKTITQQAKEKKKNPDGGNCAWYQCQQNCRVCNELLSQSMG